MIWKNYVLLWHPHKSCELKMQKQAQMQWIFVQIPKFLLSANRGAQNIDTGM